MSNWIVAGVQMDCALGDLAANRAAIVANIRRAAERGAKLVVFPECVLSGYGFDSREHARAAAEPLPGPSTDFIAQACAELGVWAVVGMLEAAPTTNCSTRARWSGPQGSSRVTASCTCRVWARTGSPIPATGRSRSTTSAG